MNNKLKKGLTTTMAAAMGLGVVIPAVPVIAAPATNSWVNTSAGWTYYQAGKKVSNGWVKDNGTWYYIDANGIMATGWRSVGGVWYFMDDNGAMATGWKSIGGKWYFMASNGAMQKGWYQVGPAWYFSNPNGDMVANQWVGNYYLGASGAMLANTLTPDNYFVDANGAWDGKAKYDLAAIETAVAKAETSKSQADVDAAKTLVNALPAIAQKDAFAKRLNAIVTTLQVSSVTAVNAKKVVVKFNKVVDKTAAESSANYTFVGLPAGTTVTPVLGTDGQTVTITLSNAIPNDTTFVTTVSEISSAADLTVKSPKYTTTTTFSDTIAPTFTGTTYPRSGVAELNFSEDLSTKGNVAVYDGTSTTASTAVSVSTFTAGDSKIVLTGLKTGKQYTVVIVGAKDQSGNLISTPIQVTVTNAINDTTAPTVTSLTTSGTDTVKVQFSEELNTIAANTYANVAVDGTSVSDTTQSFDTDTNTLTITKTGLTSVGVHAVTISGYTDYAKNPTTDYTKTVGFTLAAPQIVKSEVVTKNNDTYLQLTFDKAPDLTKVKSTGYTLSYLNSESIQKSATVAADDITADNTDATAPKILFKVTNFETGAYTLVLPKANVTDGTTDASSNATINFTLTSTTDTSVPQILNVFLPGTDASSVVAGVTAVPLNTIYVKYDRTMSAAAINPANYSIDGTSAFSSAIFVGDKTVVKLTLKDSAVTLSGDHNFLVSSNVTGDNNVAIKAYTQVMTINENVKPTLVSAKLTGAKTIELTFSEKVKDSTFTASEYTVAIDGTTDALGTTAFTTGTTADDNTIVLNLGTDVTADQLANSAITVKYAPTSTTTLKDLVGNVAVSGNTLTVSK